MEKTNVVKKFPIFWTCVNRNGVQTINQVRFKRLVVMADQEKRCIAAAAAIEFPYNLQEVKVVFAELEIANLDGTFIQSEFGMNYDKIPYKAIDMRTIFSSKEKALEYMGGKKTTRDFDYLAGTFITRDNPIYDSVFSWFNNEPENMFGEINNKNYRLVSYRWSGCKTIKVAVTCDNSELGYPNSHIPQDIPLFDMVSREWVGKFKYNYYKTIKECEKDNMVQVYVFDED